MTTNGNPNMIKELYRRGCMALAVLPCGSFDAFQLLQSITGLRDRSALALRGSETVDAQKRAAYDALLTRRLAGEPLQYLLGEWEFFGRPIEVGPGVLIPRPETELLAQVVLDEVRALSSPKLLELCAGSGCISVSVACALPQSRITAVELYDDAFSYLKRNIEKNGCRNIAPVQGDVFALPPAIVKERYHIIFANPPYIAAGEIASLQAEVQREPRTALDGGADGLDFYRALPGICLPLLAPGGLLAMEIGDEQGEDVSALLCDAGYAEIKLMQDLEHRDRVVIGRRK